MRQSHRFCKNYVSYKFRSGFDGYARPCLNRGLRLAAVWPSCAKSRFLLSSHTFCDKFLCVPGRLVSFRNYGIPGLPAHGHARHPITTPPKSSTHVWKGIIEFICVLSCILIDVPSQTTRSDTFCTTLPCVLNHGTLYLRVFKPTIKVLCVLSWILMDGFSEPIRSDTFCVTLPCFLKHDTLSPACF